MADTLVCIFTRGSDLVGTLVLVCLQQISSRSRKTFVTMESVPVGVAPFHRIVGGSVLDHHVYVDQQ